MDRIKRSCFQVICDIRVKNVESTFTSNAIFKRHYFLCHFISSLSSVKPQFDEPWMQWRFHFSWHKSWCSPLSRYRPSDSFLCSDTSEEKTDFERPTKLQKKQTSQIMDSLAQSLWWTYFCGDIRYSRSQNKLKGYIDSSEQECYNYKKLTWESLMKKLIKLWEIVNSLDTSSIRRVIHYPDTQ